MTHTMPPLSLKQFVTIESRVTLTFSGMCSLLLTDPNKTLFFQLRLFFLSQDCDGDDAEKESPLIRSELLLDDELLDEDVLGYELDRELDHLNRISSFLQILGVQVCPRSSSSHHSCH